jgi:hypothetical protein
MRSRSGRDFICTREAKEFVWSFAAPLLRVARKTQNAGMTEVRKLIISTLKSAQTPVNVKLPSPPPELAKRWAQKY